MNLCMTCVFRRVLSTNWLTAVVMAKSKNHTNHNQNKKAHRNGIKKPKKHVFLSMKGVDAKFLKNLRFARKNNKRQVKSVESKA